MYYRIILLTLFVQAVQLLCAQPSEYVRPKGAIDKSAFSVPDTVSVEEATAHFFQALERPDDENVAYPMRDSLQLGYCAQSVLASCPILSEAERKQLQGCWNYLDYDKVDKSTYDNNTYNSCLALRKLNSEIAPEIALNAYQKLKKKYGTIPHPHIDDTFLIPAKWFTGELVYVYHLYEYMNFRLGDRRWASIVKKGKKLDGNYYSSCSGLYSDETEEGFGPIYSEGAMIKRKVETALFAHDINKICPIRISDSEKNAAFRLEADFLLTVNKEGKASIWLLRAKNDTLNPSQQQLLAELQQAVASLPPWSFGMAYNEDGRVFPYRYLYGRYSSAGWFFRDYFGIKPRRGKWLPSITIE